jgi:hypothetical protein
MLALRAMSEVSLFIHAGRALNAVCHKQHGYMDVHITPRSDSSRGQVDVAHHPDCYSRNETCTGEHP